MSIRISVKGGVGYNRVPFRVGEHTPLPPVGVRRLGWRHTPLPSVAPLCDTLYPPTTTVSVCANVLVRSYALGARAVREVQGLGAP